MAFAAPDELAACLQEQLASAFPQHVVYPACQVFDPSNKSHGRMVAANPHLITAVPSGGYPCVVLVTRAGGAEVAAVVSRRRPVRALVLRAHFEREAYDGTLMYGYHVPRNSEITIVDASYLAGRALPHALDVRDRAERTLEFLRRAWHSTPSLSLSVHRFWTPTEATVTQVASGSRGVLLYPARGRCSTLFFCPRHPPQPASRSPPPEREPTDTIVPRREFFAFRTGCPDVYNLVPVAHIPSDVAAGVPTLCVKTLTESRFMSCAFEASRSDRVRIMCIMDRELRKWAPELPSEKSVTCFV